MRNFVVPALVMVAAVLSFAGCGGSGGLHPVSGKVSYVGGGVPQGEISTIQFDPIEGTTAEGERKGAFGNIEPDGTYRLTTIDQNDGAYAGEYKVTFKVVKTYIGNETLVDRKATEAKTTPHTATVKAGGDNHFDFEVAKAPGT